MKYAINFVIALCRTRTSKEWIDIALGALLLTGGTILLPPPNAEYFWAKLLASIGLIALGGFSMFFFFVAEMASVKTWLKYGFKAVHIPRDINDAQKFAEPVNKILTRLALDEKTDELERCWTHFKKLHIPMPDTGPRAFTLRILRETESAIRYFVF